MRHLRFAAIGVVAACGHATTPRDHRQPPPDVDAAVAAPEVDAAAVSSNAAADPYLWLEDVTGDRAMTWVRDQNARSQHELEARPGFDDLRKRLLAIYDSKARIPYAAAMDKWLYNLWTDDQHPRGLWRRTTLAEYAKAKPKWEVVLDVDALGAAEHESWVWQGADCLYPKYTRCLISLSRGGADAVVVREFDITSKRFMADGFILPEGKSNTSWKDLDTITVGTDFGAGSLTTSGYPRVEKEWRRGTPLAEAKTIYEGQTGDVSVNAYRQFDHGKTYDWVSRDPSFFTNELYLRTGDQLDKIAKPDDATAGIWNDQIIITLRTAWQTDDHTWPAGALLIEPFGDFQAGKRDFTMLFEPKANTSLDGFAATKTAIVVTELEDVKSEVYLWKRDKRGWQRAKVETPAVGSIYVTPYDRDRSDDYWMTVTGYTTPSALSLGNIGRKARKPFKQNPAFFDVKGLEVTQHFATSADGVKVPYFQIARTGLPLDGTTPTILEGYGGFEVSLTPGYDSTAGAAWLERGGVFVVANIRGGGEYGPAWHTAALKHDRQRAYDDFISVAEDLIARKVTSTPKLGIVGGSNGGLLMGVMLTERPDLFGAVVCMAPLLDMKRYTKLLAGASWMGEYGDPDNADDWAALSRFSPYQNIKAGVRYPRTLFTASTRDDRVHPGHARKMAARLLENQQDLLYYENIEGGHGGAADNPQRAYMGALTYSFFAEQLGL